MSNLMSKVSHTMSDTVDQVRGNMRRRRRRQMMSERWPLFVVGALLVAGLTAGIAFAIANRHSRNDMMNMNTQLDDLLGGGTSHDPVL